jgi:hypothetical protein
MVKTNYLLNQVGSLLKSYEKLAKSTGENFNIFSVMGMESNEVKTHSAIIGELLNPKGSHGLEDKLLKLFIELVVKPLYRLEDGTYGKFEEKFNFDFESTCSKVEEFAGAINNDATEGGRIDIVIKDNKEKVFLIENKIYASEQKNQLGRYNKFYPNAPILFLTLDGKDSETAHELEKNNHYFTISYENEILLWLQECVKEAVKFPMLREVIYQYINLIKKLTNQTMNTELKKEISELIKSNFIESSQIANNFEEVKNTIIIDFFKDVANAFNQYNENTDWEMILNENNTNQYFIKNRNWSNVALAIWKKDAIYYGVKLINTLKDNQKQLVPEAIVKGFKTSPNSLLWNDKFVIKINTAQDVVELINNKDKKIKMIIDFIGFMITELAEYCKKTNEILTLKK